MSNTATKQQRNTIPGTDDLMRRAFARGVGDYKAGVSFKTEAYTIPPLQREWERGWLAGQCAEHDTEAA